MGRPLAVAVVLLGLAIERSAHAEPAARFIYLRGRGTETCPAEADVRQAVVGRLGYDPFSSYAAATMFAEVSAAENHGFSASLKLVDADNTVRGDRVLKTQGACSELMEAMALTISIAIDPESATREGPPPGAPPAERPVTALPAIADDSQPEVSKLPSTGSHDVVTPPAAASIRAISASLGPLMSIGTAPGVSVGGVLSVDGQYGLLFGGIEGRADAPASADATPSGRVRSSLVMGSLFLGLRRGLAYFGAVTGAGSVHATSRDVAAEREADAFIANLGLRAGLAIPLRTWLELRARVEGLANLTRHTLQLDGRAAYRYPVVSADLSAALAVRFW
jgi:hypothetical protein